jgi:hypothetical protein
MKVRARDQRPTAPEPAAEPAPPQPSTIDIVEALKEALAGQAKEIAKAMQKGPVSFEMKMNRDKDKLLSSITVTSSTPKLN